MFSPDKGKTWEAYETPIANSEGAQGIYSIDFWTEYLGIAVGGDYTNPEGNTANKAITIDGGKTWQQTLFVSNKVGCGDLVIDPKNPNIDNIASFKHFLTLILCSRFVKNLQKYAK